MKFLLITTLSILSLATCLHAKQAALKKNDRIVFLGDSITAAGPRPGGYITLSAEAIAKAHPDLNIELIGAGIGGHKVPDCQRRLDKDVLQKKPTIVFIYIGINDVWHWTHPRVVARGKKGTTPEAFESGLRDMIKKINGVGARVILCTPTVIGEKSDGTNPDDQRLDEYSDISRKVAKETGSQLLDLRKGFIAYLKKHNTKNATEGILTSDSVHMNPAGNQLLAKLVLGALQVPASTTSATAPASIPATTPAFVEESVDAYNKRMQWFTDAQYGMFIHFGLYSQLGGEYKGTPTAKNQKYSEWIQAHLEIPREEYAEIAKDFNPAQFDADLIASTAKAAGMKYLVITSKHHDGFCLWDSEFTDFDTASTPFKDRDLLGELNEACKKHGIKFGLYYSILDWHHPTQVNNPEAKNPNHRWSRSLLRDGGKEDKKTYVTYQKNQILELIKKYDPAVLWFDGEWVDWWTNEDGIDLYNAIREASPHTITNNRVGKRKSFEADFVTKEQRHFEEAFPKHWEACYTMNKSWGYKKGDDDWKDAATVYEKLKDVNEKGGNLLLNVGPDGNGVVQQEAISILLETGKLLEATPIAKRQPSITEVPRLTQSNKKARKNKKKK